MLRPRFGDTFPREGNRNCLYYSYGQAVLSHPFGDTFPREGNRNSSFRPLSIARCFFGDTFPPRRESKLVVKDGCGKVSDRLWRHFPAGKESKRTVEFLTDAKRLKSLETLSRSKGIETGFSGGV